MRRLQEEKERACGWSGVNVCVLLRVNSLILRVAMIFYQHIPLKLFCLLNTRFKLGFKS